MCPRATHALLAYVRIGWARLVGRIGQVKKAHFIGRMGMLPGTALWPNVAASARPDHVAAFVRPAQGSLTAHGHPTDIARWPNVVTLTRHGSLAPCGRIGKAQFMSHI